MIFPLPVSADTAADWRSFAAGSGPSEDSLLLDVMDGHDLDTELAICQGVVERRDHAVGGFIDALAARHHGVGPSSDRAELLLRVTVAGLFSDGLTDAETAVRVSANRSALEDLERRITEWRDPQLVSLLVGLAPRMDPGIGLPALMRVYVRLVGALRDGRGDTSPPMTALGLAWCRAVETAGGRDFLDPCVTVASLSTDPDLVAAARRAARQLVVR
ncbi:MAG TPA: hypothetical protein VHE79_10465 [Spirochaetia bacterium]